MSESLRVVFDTQIYLRAAINPQSICGKLFAQWTSSYVLFVSDRIEGEILDVLSRSRIRAKFPQITDATVKDVKLTLGRARRISLDAKDIRAVSRDPKDDVFLACAKAAKADYLVSEDHELLVLKQHETTKIVSALDFLTVLETL